MYVFGSQSALDRREDIPARRGELRGELRGRAPRQRTSRRGAASSAAELDG